MSTDLIAFLRARLDEDEQAARAANSGWYSYDAEQAIAFVPVEDAQHIARHSPARVLAEVEAKRQIIKQHERYAAERRRMMGGWDPRSDDSPILSALAAVYADHSDYQPDWRP
ncbi:DUF6221 family protein [Streptomyces sp. NPDC015130]|uniref:DUF6221 family protein n=1 Tax=Streptomyces sp. NPDC015130 TaxID=3364940 RepID=UPI0036FDE98F